MTHRLIYFIKDLVSGELISGDNQTGSETGSDPVRTGSSIYRSESSSSVNSNLSSESDFDRIKKFWNCQEQIRRYDVITTHESSPMTSSLIIDDVIICTMNHNP